MNDFMASSIHSPEYRRLCSLLIAARESAGYTQAEVAKRLGRPQSFVSKVERGERRLDVIEFLGLASVLEIELTVFFANLIQIGSIAD